MKIARPALPGNLLANDGVPVGPAEISSTRRSGGTGGENGITDSISLRSVDDEGRFAEVCGREAVQSILRKNSLKPTIRWPVHDREKNRRAEFQQHQHFPLDIAANAARLVGQHARRQANRDVAGVFPGEFPVSDMDSALNQCHL